MKLALSFAVLAACRSTSPALDQRALNAEAQVQLNRLSKSLKTVWNTTAAFPVGKAGPTPATPCCKNADGRCPPTVAWSTDRIWRELDFEVLDAGHFQFAYESDGTSATALAIADLDCDGTAIRYTLTLTTQDGVPRAVLDQPPVGAD